MRLSGIFAPDLYLPGVLKDPPADPSEPVPKALPAAVEGAGAVVTLDHPSPGDVICTGTPGAVEIRDGDVVECRITSFEPLSNVVRR